VRPCREARRGKNVKTAPWMSKPPTEAIHPAQTAGFPITSVTRAFERVPACAGGRAGTAKPTIMAMPVTTALARNAGR
jgi:hypothetical protein